MSADVVNYIMNTAEYPFLKHCRCVAGVAFTKDFHACAFEVHHSPDSSVHGLLTVSNWDGLKWSSRSFLVRLPDQSSEFLSQIISSYTIHKKLEGFQEVFNTAIEAFSMQTSFRSAHEAETVNAAHIRSPHTVPAVPDRHKLVEVEQKCKKSIKDLTKYFHLPINLAARELGICPTVLKKICRKHGLQRWPYRKLRSIDRLLEKLQSSANEVKSPSVFCIHSQKLSERIQMLKVERAQLCFEAQPVNES